MASSSSSVYGGQSRRQGIRSRCGCGDPVGKWTGWRPTNPGRSRRQVVVTLFGLTPNCQTSGTKIPCLICTTMAWEKLKKSITLMSMRNLWWKLSLEKMKLENGR
ncbi:hypothetical protein LXL04_020674 [Taraxacum kok-saghyz]